MAATTHKAPPGALYAPPFEMMANAGQKALTSATQANARALCGMLAMQRHMLDFVTRRIDRDLAAAEALTKCADAPEIAAVTQEFYACAVMDYSDESAEFLRRGAEIAGASAVGAVAASKSAENGAAPEV